MKTLIVIPTYNEKDNILRLLERVLKIDSGLEVLVVDDNSPDGTAGLVEQFRRKHPRVHLLNRPQKQGIGPAYIAGFKWGLARPYDAFMEMDADLSHRPRYLPKFLENIKKFDLVVGSRWMKGGRIANWPLSRVLLSRMASLYCKLILWVPVADMTAGFVCYRRSVLEGVNLDGIHSDGYCFQIEMKYRALLKGFTIKEIPILFTDRRVGSSKISRRIVFEALLVTWLLRFKKRNLIGERTSKTPGKFFSFFFMLWVICVVFFYFWGIWRSKLG